jgi:SAM-dependent methyltransferase
MGRIRWDIGKPQKAFIDVAEQITGSILDAGCGTGDNVLYFASRGHKVTGIVRQLVNAVATCANVGARYRNDSWEHDILPLRPERMARERQWIRCFFQSGIAAMGCNCRKWIGSRPRPERGKKSTSSWMFGARFSRFMIWLIRARLTCPSSASSA